MCPRRVLGPLVRIVFASRPILGRDGGPDTSQGKRMSETSVPGWEFSAVLVSRGLAGRPGVV